MNLECIDVAHNKVGVCIRNRFFNTANELCATAITQLNWFDNDSLGWISPPEKIMKHFLIQNQQQIYV